MTTKSRPNSASGSTLDAAISRPSPSATDSIAVSVSACLIVAAHASGAPAVEGMLVDADSGQTQPIALPWRAPLRAVVERVGAALAALPDYRALAVGSGLVWFKWRGGSPIAADAGGTGTALLSARLKSTLTAIAENPALPAGRVSLWSAEDERVVASAHTPCAEVSGTVAELVRDQIARFGDRVAIEDGGRLVTYAQFGELVDTKARRLVASAVAPGEVVGLALPRGTDLVATLLALWSIGAAFLPIDPGHPRPRLEAALSVAGARVVLSAGRDSGAELEFDCCSVLRWDLDDIGSEAPSTASRTRLPHPADLAYAMTTSGSTGEPKVVAVSHGALIHCLSSFACLLAAPFPRVAWTTALTFDVSILEILLPLVVGGRLLIADDATRRDPDELAVWLSDRSPDVVQATPSAWRLLLPALKERLDGTVLLCGGEPLTAELAVDLAATGARVWNVYGPTEATIWCVAGQVAAPFADPVSIGRPLPGVVAAVLDRQGNPVPIGQAGELHLRGVQLATGYLGDPERTAAAFTDSAAGMAYRTGDRCAWRPDGTLEYRGRVDNQVKLRGHRVELEEIEAHAERHPGVARAAAVLVQREPGDQRLFLYYQPRQAPQVDEELLREHLARWLPAAVLPQHVTALARLPLTHNQKVDRRTLREAACAALGPGPTNG